jgi:hypothetical protein
LESIVTDVEHQIAELELRAYALATVNLSRADIEQTDAAILARATLAREVEQLLDQQQPGEQYDTGCMPGTRSASAGCTVGV